MTKPAYLTVANIRGSVDVQPSDDGGVTVTAVKHLETGDSDQTEIEIRQTKDGSMTVKTGSSVSGDLVLETSLGEGPYRFKTMSGNLKLILPLDARCPVGFNSISGRLKTTLPTTRSQWQRHKWRAELQGGGPEVRFSSVSSDFSMMQVAC